MVSKRVFQRLASISLCLLVIGRPMFPLSAFAQHAGTMPAVHSGLPTFHASGAGTTPYVHHHTEQPNIQHHHSDSFGASSTSSNTNNNTTNSNTTSTTPTQHSGAGFTTVDQAGAGAHHGLNLHHVTGDHSTFTTRQLRQMDKLALVVTMLVM